MKIIDLVAKYSPKLAKEWFRLLEWLLIIGGLWAYGEKYNNLLISFLALISIIFLMLYIIFGILNFSLANLPNYPNNSICTLVKTALIYGLPLLAAFLLAIFFKNLAVYFFVNHISN